MVVVKDYVYLIELCEYYGFIVFMFIFVQMLFVLLIVINVFVLMKFGKNLDFGKYDWKLLLLIFGFFFVECFIVIVVGKIGLMGVQ